MKDPHELDDLYEWMEEPEVEEGHEHWFRPLYHYTKPFHGNWRVFYCTCGQHCEYEIVKPPELTWAIILHEGE